MWATAFWLAVNSAASPARQAAQLQGEAIDAQTGSLVGMFGVKKLGNFDDKKDLSWEDVRGTLEHATKQVAAVKFEKSQAGLAAQAPMQNFPNSG